MTPPKKKKSLFINIAFVVTSVALVAFLLNAPEETTTKVPHDADHERFFGMNKKAAGKLCVECHNPENVTFPDGHPPKYRCLFCHKRD